jgi:hypothetical protein
MDLVRCLARPALLILRHPLFPLFFPGLSVVGVQSSIALATKESGLQEIYLYKKKICIAFQDTATHFKMGKKYYPRRLDRKTEVK